MLIFNLLHGGHLGFRNIPKINSVRCSGGIKVISKCEFNPTSGFQSLLHSQAISCIDYNVNLQTIVAAILVFVECPKSIASKDLMVLRSYQNMKSTQQAVFNLSRSQAIFCIGYNVNLQTVVAVILVLVECPKSIASEVLVLFRPYQNVKSI